MYDGIIICWNRRKSSCGWLSFNDAAVIFINAALFIKSSNVGAPHPKGIIFTGGPNSAYLEDSPKIAKEIFEIGVPILGICYGIQVMSHILGGNVRKGTNAEKEYGKTEITYNESAIFELKAQSTFLSPIISFNSFILSVIKESVVQSPLTFDMNLIRVNCEDRFLGKLKGVTEPEAKRKIIGEEFIRVFEEESNKLGNSSYTY